MVSQAQERQDSDCQPTSSPSRIKLSIQTGNFDSDPESSIHESPEVCLKPRVGNVIVTGPAVDASAGEPPLIVCPAAGRGVEEEPQLPIVRFASEMHVSVEGDTATSLTVIRRGCLETAVSVRWSNENVSTSSGSFLPQSGVVRFGAGETHAQIEIQLLDDAAWNLEAVQTVKLLESEWEQTVEEGMGGRKEAPAGAFFLDSPSCATIAVINDDPFPHGLRDDQVADKTLVVRRFMQHLRDLMDSETTWGTVYKAWDGVKSVVDQVILLLFLTLVLEDLESDQRQNVIQLCMLCGLYIANFALSHLFDWLFIRLRLGGKARINLRRAIATTAVQFSKAEESKFPPGKTARVLESDVEAATTAVWLSSFQLVSLLSSLLCNLIYITYLNMSGGLDSSLLVLTIALTLMPVMIYVVDVITLVTNYHKSADLAYRASEASDDVANYGTELYGLRQAIMDANRSQPCQQKFTRLHAHANNVNLDGDLHRCASEYTARWMSTLLSAAIFFLTGYQVLVASYPVANFVTLFNSLRYFTATLTGIFAVSFKLLEGYAPVMKIREVLNAETRNRELLRFSQKQQQLLEALEKDGSVRPLADSELRLQGVVFAFNREGEVFPPLSLAMEAGQAVALYSKSSAGMRTILQLMAKHIFPLEGLIVYPSDWRVCFIDSPPLLFDDTLMANLRFREVHEHTDEEVWDLCRLFGLNPELIGQGDLLLGNGGSKLSRTDRTMVSLICGMLSSPDLILLPGILDALGKSLAAKLWKRCRPTSETAASRACGRKTSGSSGQGPSESWSCSRPR